MATKKTASARKSSRKSSARKSKTPEHPERVMDGERKVDLFVGMGFVVRVDNDLTYADGSRPSSSQKENAATGMLDRYEDEVRTALEAIYGPNRVFFFGNNGGRDCFTGDTENGSQRGVFTVESPSPAEESEEEVDTADLPKMKVAELRELCEENGLDAKGKKADLVKRLQEHAAA